MASQQPTTRVQSPPGPPSAPPRSDGLDLTTLILSAVASAVAAYVTSRLWAPGTLFSAAMSPVIVALVKEGLRRPTQVVTAVVPTPRVRTTRSQRTEALPDDLTEQLAAGAPPAFPPPQPGAAEGPIRIHSTRARRLRWRIAVVTGLLGFGLCVVLYTVPELLAGQSVGSSGRATTLWGGSTHKKSTSKTTQTTTTTTTAPTKTVTVPAQTTTAPQATTPQTTVTTPPATTPQATTPAAPAPAPSSATP